MTISEKIKARRQALGLTMEQVALQMNVSKGTIYKWEHGVIASMRRDKVAELAKILQVSPMYLIFEDNEEIAPAPREDVTEILEVIKNRPEMRMLFSCSKNATKEDIEKAIKIIEALKANE